jgi:hypothetical protein
LDLWNSDTKKPFWPEDAGYVDSIFEDNTTIESAKKPEYTNCVNIE